MSRFSLRFALLPLAFFTAVLLLIHAQPYDDHDLRQLLMPEGCPAPCFMGIRPGVTMVAEIIKTPHKRILEFQLITFENSQIVDSIDVKTSIPFGEIFLLLGGGTSNEHYRVYGEMARPEITALYPTQNLIVHGESDCPISKRKYWNSPVSLNIVSGELYLPDYLILCPRDY